MSPTIDRIAKTLARAEKPVLVAGYGTVVAEASEELVELLGQLPRLRVMSTPKAKGVVSETHRQYLGVVGFAGHATALEYLFESADFVLVVGTRLGELTSNNWDARWLQLNLARIDVCELTLGSWCASELSVKGEAKVVLRSISERLTKLAPRASLVETMSAHDMGARSAVDCLAEDYTAEDCTVAAEAAHNATDDNHDEALTPRHVFELLNQNFPDDGHIFSGIGNTMAWGIHYLRRPLANRWHVNLASGAMGHAIPAAIGAALTGAASLAIVGDAEFLMTGYELHTAVENRLNLTVIVLNDAGHGMVRVGSRVHCQGTTPSVDFTHPVDLVMASRAQGAHATRVNFAEDLVRELCAAARREGPTVIDVPISRDLTPPLGARLEALSQAFANAAVDREDTNA